MTKDEYRKLVKETASTFLVDCEAADWKKENEEGDFSAFYDHAEYDGYDGGFHSIIDCEFSGVDWQEAIKYLQCTEQNPDHVDSGLYEGCSWKKILVVIAFEAFSWDVREEAERMFDRGDFGQVVKAFPTNQRQLGFYPDHKLYKIPKGPWAQNMCGDGVKILILSRQPIRQQLRIRGANEPELAVVFEGPVSERPSSFVVACRRIYTQGGDDADIKKDLKRCEEEFGVRATRGKARGGAQA